MGDLAASRKENPDRSQSGSNGREGRKWRWVAVLIVVTVTIAAGYVWFFMRGRVSTEDAYAVADSAVVSSRVPGTIEAIFTENDRFVEAGDTLVQLDPRDYKAVVDKQQAALARIEARIQAAEVTIRLTRTQTGSQTDAAGAMVQVAQDKEREARHRLEQLEQNRAAALAELNHATRDYERYKNLYEKGAGSEQQRDRTQTALKKARAQFDAAQAQVAAAQAAVAAGKQEVDRAKAELENAEADRLRTDVEVYKLEALRAERDQIRAELETARLNLSYCTIGAPLSGYVAQKRIQVGDRVQSGQPLLAVVPLREIYVEANFKETQLEDVRIGQSAEISADIYPNYTFHGKVAGIRAGTGAAFSLLPPENATGNWIKVVQRVPVKILLDAPPPVDYPLRVGLSLEVTISTADKSGPRLAEKEKPKLAVQGEVK